MTTTTTTKSDRAEWHARDATPTEALNAWTERAAKLEAENARLRRELDERPPVTFDDAYIAIRAVRDERDELRTEMDEIEAELHEYFGEERVDDSALTKVRVLIAWDRESSEFIHGKIEPLLGLDDNPGEIPDAIRRLIEERDQLRDSIERAAAVLDDAAEATARMVAAIQGQARDGETPDQTVERLIRERRFLESQHDLFKRASDIDGEILDAIRAALGTPEGVDVTEHARTVAADLRRTEHDLARLMVLVRADGCEWEDVQTLCDEIEERGAPGWLERALSDETAEPVRQERAEWEARVSEAVQEGERRIDAIDRQHSALVATIRDAIPTIRAGINALGSSEEDVRQRSTARDSLHALAGAVAGAEPAAVLSAAELEVVRGVLDAAAAINAAGDDADLLHEAHGYWAQAWAAYEAAGRPLASEGAA